MNPHFCITDKSLIYAILDKAEYGALALSHDDTPYAVPVNFVRVGDAIYFHGALKSRKMTMLSRNPVVSFSVVESYALIPSSFSSTDGLACPATHFFKSVHIEGTAEVVESREEKAEVFEAMMQKLQPEGGYKPFDDAVYDKPLKTTAVVKIAISDISCKCKFGQHLSEERFEMICAHLQERGSGIDRTVEVMRELRRNIT